MKLESKLCTRQPWFSTESPTFSWIFGSTSLWEPILCPAPTNQNAVDQNGFKHKERVKMLIREGEGTGGDYSAQPCIFAGVGCSCGLLVARASPPFWADQVWIDWVSWCAAGSSKAAQALIVVIRHGESRQKGRGSDCKCCLFQGPELLPRAAWAPRLHSPPPSSKSIISVEAHPGLDDVSCLSGRVLLSLANIC